MIAMSTKGMIRQMVSCPNCSRMVYGSIDAGSCNHCSVIWGTCTPKIPQRKENKMNKIYDSLGTCTGCGREFTKEDTSFNHECKKMNVTEFTTDTRTSILQEVEKRVEGLDYYRGDQLSSFEKGYREARDDVLAILQEMKGEK